MFLAPKKGINISIFNKFKESCPLVLTLKTPLVIDLPENALKTSTMLENARVGFLKYSLSSNNLLVSLKCSIFYVFWNL